MVNKSYNTDSFDTAFPLDKNPKNSYNEINVLQKNKNIFDDETANSALDYFYSNDKSKKDNTNIVGAFFPFASLDFIIMCKIGCN